MSAVVTCTLLATVSSPPTASLLPDSERERSRRQEARPVPDGMSARQGQPEPAGHRNHTRLTHAPGFGEQDQRARYVPDPRARSGLRRTPAETITRLTCAFALQRTPMLPLAPDFQTSSHSPAPRRIRADARRNRNPVTCGYMDFGGCRRTPRPTRTPKVALTAGGTLETASLHRRRDPENTTQLNTEPPPADSPPPSRTDHGAVERCMRTREAPRKKALRSTLPRGGAFLSCVSGAASAPE